MFKDISPARLAAFEILRKVADGSFSSVALASKEPELQPVDRALCHELVMGVLRWQLNLDKVIEHHANRKIETLDLPVLIALRLGIYQLRFLSRIPASAAVNESVNLVGVARLTSARAFVNAVLRRATREANFDPVTHISDRWQRLAIQTSHPAWLIERWANAFGTDEAEEFARANNEIPPTAIRVVSTRASELVVLHKLQEAGATVTASEVTTGAWRVNGASLVVRELAAAGEIYLQDEASQIPAHALDAHGTDRVLDLCAAPGGKTTQIAALADDQAFVVAGDLSWKRLATVSSAARAQQLKSIRLLQLDGSVQLPFAENAFDRVLLDAPCSGTGTLRRNPEIRWRITPDDIKSLATRQKQLLLNVATVVKRGGRLVYSTCSVELEENEQVISHFMQTNGDFQQIAIDSPLRTETGTVRTWPHRQGSDGFFVAAFERKR